MRAGTQFHGTLHLVAAALALAVVGCATAYESGIVDRGGGVFYVAVRTPQGEGGGNESLKKARAQINAHCAKTGKTARVVNEEVGPVQADLLFTCGN